MRVDMFWSVLVGLICVAAGMMGDHCDWTGSGLSTSLEKRGVTPVYLRCREGTVSWLYPRGALRLLIRPSHHSGEKEFSICIRVIRKDDPPDLFHKFDHNLLNVKAERFPARIFVEGSKKLLPLYAPDDNDPRELRCFRSRKGRSALYVEAEPEEGPQRRVATFRYETKPLMRRHYDPATADCKPCSDDELELAFCTSDLVTRGTITASEERADLDSTQLTLRVSKLLRSTGYDVRQISDSPGPQGEENYSYVLEDNSIDQEWTTTHRNHKRRKGSLHAHIHVSSVCGASAGEGEFLVMARRRLGRYSLVCAPRIHDWIQFVKRRNADGDTQCILKH